MGTEETKKEKDSDSDSDSDVAVVIDGIYLKQPPKQLLASILEIFSPHFRYMPENSLKDLLYNSIKIVNSYCNTTQIGQIKYKKESKRFLKYTHKLLKMKPGPDKSPREWVLEVMYNVILSGEGITTHDQSIFIPPSWSLALKDYPLPLPAPAKKKKIRKIIAKVREYIKPIRCKIKM